MATLPHVVTSLGAVKPHVRKVAEEITARWPLYFVWGYAAKKGEHGKGLALDFMTYELGGGVKDPGPLRDQVGNEIADYLWSNRRRLGVWYLIWQRRIISTHNNDYGPAGRWNRMPDRGDPTANHMDHVHVSFEASHTYQPPKDDSDVALTDAEIKKIAAAVWAEKLQPGKVAKRIGGYPDKFEATAEGWEIGPDAKANEIRRTLASIAKALDKLADTLPLATRAAVREALKDAVVQVDVDVNTKDPT